jgi:hypothetical protein
MRLINTRRNLKELQTARTNDNNANGEEWNVILLPLRATLSGSFHSRITFWNRDPYTN